VAGFLRFLGYAAGIYQATLEPFMLKPPASLGDMLTPAMARNTPALDPLRTVDQAVRSFFHSPYLRQLFNRYATYNGSSPYRAPATFNVIPYVEFAQGGWYVRGGIYAIVKALQQAAQRLGVEMRTSTPVAAIESERGCVRAVRLASGEVLRASAVVVNADPQVAYRSLLGHTRMAERLERLELSSSGFVLLLGVDRRYDRLAHHTIFFSGDYPAEFAALFDHGVPPADPTIYVNVTSPIDPQHAPPGHSNLFVLVNAPAQRGAGSRVNWEREATPYGDLVIRKLERMGLVNLGQHIRYRRTLTPLDLEQRYHAPGGAIYGLASNSPWSAFRRPPLRSPAYRGLYFAGGGTHPGGGIPLVLLSGRSAARLVLGDS
jgi:phytoene desaturase